MAQIFITYEYKENTFKTANIYQKYENISRISVSNIVSTNSREHNSKT